jgi:hypothetical protein
MSLYNGLLYFLLIDTRNISIILLSKQTLLIKEKNNTPSIPNYLSVLTGTQTLRNL